MYCISRMDLPTLQKFLLAIKDASPLVGVKTTLLCRFMTRVQSLGTATSSPSRGNLARRAFQGIFCIELTALYPEKKNRVEKLQTAVLYSSESADS